VAWTRNEEDDSIQFEVQAFYLESDGIVGDGTHYVINYICNYLINIDNYRLR